MTKAFESNGSVSATRAAAIAAERGLSIDDLMLELLAEASALAHPPISNFKVGVVARGLSGALYAGANYEIANEALGFTVHAEQSAIANAWMAGERGVDRIAVSAAPCGLCRQFLNELITADTLVVQMPNETKTLRELLPAAFGPRDLDVRDALMAEQRHRISVPEPDELTHAAVVAAAMSYAPYSHAWSGIALRTGDGTIVTGAYAENAAFNPSLPAVQAALSQMNLRRLDPITIADAVLVQTGTMHTSTTRLVLSAVSRASLRIVTA
jgi:cytidine deaminase